MVALAMLGAGLAQLPEAKQANRVTTGTLAGRALFSGTPPPRDVLSMNVNPVCVERAGPMVQSQAVLVDQNGGLQNVFVYIKAGLDPTHAFEIPEAPVVLEQVGCQYSPRVFGVRAGQPLEILNSDPTLHNTHARPAVNQEFNIGQPIQGMRARRIFTTPEVMVPLSSDVHRWMVAFLGVMAHPFFAVTGADGSFVISGIPPGTYSVETWHERFGGVTHEVAIDADRTTMVSFTFGNR
jgi:hypothetical protein